MSVWNQFEINPIRAQLSFASGELWICCCCSVVLNTVLSSCPWTPQDSSGQVQVCRTSASSSCRVHPESSGSEMSSVTVECRWLVVEKLWFNICWQEQKLQVSFSVPGSRKCVHTELKQQKQLTGLLSKSKNGVKMHHHRQQGLKNSQSSLNQIQNYNKTLWFKKVWNASISWKYRHHVIVYLCCRIRN